jgi:hypothetical protein
MDSENLTRTSGAETNLPRSAVMINGFFAEFIHFNAVSKDDFSGTELFVVFIL